MTPPPDDAWTPPERPEPGAPGPDRSQRPAYGSPSSPSYGLYGQGQAAPVPNEPASPVTGQQPYGQPDHRGQGAWVPGAVAVTPSGGLGLAVIVLSALVTGTLWVTALLAPGADRSVERAVAQGTSVTDALASYSAISVLSLPIWIGAWVLSSVWLARVQGNAMRLRPGGQRRAPAWAWFGWLVPIVSFWFPKQILDDTIEATDRPSRPETPDPRGSLPAATSRWAGTGPYWAAWVTLNVLSGVGFRLSEQAAPEDSIVPALSFTIAIVATIALVLWIRLVRRISSAQDRLARTGP